MGKTQVIMEKLMDELVKEFPISNYKDIPIFTTYYDLYNMLVERGVIQHE